MRKNLSIWMLGIAAVLASCSSEDTLQGTTDNDGLVRITVQLEDGMKTRAATPEEDGESAKVTRFVLNAYETTEDGTIQQKATDVVITPLGGGSFTAKLDRQKYYKFFCWADEGDASSYTITNDDLTSITLKQNEEGTGYMLPSIAHRGESSVVYGETADEVPIQLKHAVAKVMLQTTGELGAGLAKLETKTCTSYNAVTNEYDYNTKVSVSKSGPEADVADSDVTPANVLQFYVLTGRTTEDVTLTDGDTSKKGGNISRILILHRSYSDVCPVPKPPAPAVGALPPARSWQTTFSGRNGAARPPNPALRRAAARRVAARMATIRWDRLWEMKNGLHLQGCGFFCASSFSLRD